MWLRPLAGLLAPRGVQGQHQRDLCRNFCQWGQACAACSALSVQAAALLALQHHRQFIWSVTVFQACLHPCFLLAMMLVIKIGWRVTAALLRRNNGTALQEAAVGRRVGEKALTSNYGKHICYAILKHGWCTALDILRNKLERNPLTPFFCVYKILKGKLSCSDLHNFDSVPTHPGVVWNVKPRGAVLSCSRQ